MHDLVGVVLPLKLSGDTPFQGMSQLMWETYAKLVRYKQNYITQYKAIKH